MPPRASRPASAASERTQTIRLLADPATRPEQLVQPGHVFPLRARPGGILERAGRTEAAVDLAGTAGLGGGAGLCPPMADDGHMARERDLERFPARHGLVIVNVSDVVEHRRAAA